MFEGKYTALFIWLLKKEVSFRKNQLIFEEYKVIKYISNITKELSLFLTKINVLSNPIKLD